MRDTSACLRGVRGTRGWGLGAARWRLARVASVAALVLACAVCAACESGPRLTVRILSDLRAGHELRRVTVTVYEGGGTCPPSDRPLVGGGGLDVGVGDDARLVGGTFTAAEVRLARGGVYLVHVVANVSGRVLDRCVVVLVNGDRVARIPIVASCQGVTCPGAGGSPEFTECLNGRCIDPRCEPDDPSTSEHCCDRAALGDACDDPTVCATAMECAPSATCRAGASCDRGVCLDGIDICPPGSFCASTEHTCVPISEPMLDAGTDVGPTDVGPTDVGPTDVGPVDAGPRDAGAVDGDAASECTSEEDCAACRTGFCAYRACGPDPGVLVYDFETEPSESWRPIGFGPWRLDTSDPHGGAQALRSGISFDGRSRMRFSITLASYASLTFWARAELPGGTDHFDAVGERLADDTFGWTQFEFLLPPGPNQVEFVFDCFLSPPCSGGAWIDDVSLGPPVDPSTGFEGVAFPLGYRGDGTVPWSVTALMPHGGGTCAQSGAVGDNQTSSLIRTVTLPSAETLTFWVRTSTVGNDRLALRVDGAVVDQWSGETPWTLVRHPLTAGSHRVEWRYQKDGADSGGADAVWIDDVSFGPPAPGGPLCGP